MWLDGLKNIVANLNTSRDKASHSTYEEITVTDEQLVAMYRTSAIAKKIVDLPAEDSLREWREWYAPKEQISLIEGEESRLGQQAAYIKASKRARLFGGSAIFIGTGDSDLEEPLDPERIAKGGIKYLTVLSRHSLMAGLLGTDPREPTYGKPISYQMNTDFAMLTIHPSRLVIFHGDELPDERYSGSRLGWSDPVLQSILTSVRNLDATVANVASLIFESKIDVIGINGFNKGLQSGGRAYETLVLTRAALTAQGKGINGTMVMDAEDTYTQKSASFATLPDIMDRFMQLTSAASSIPMTLLFGMSAGGLNSTGESDTRGYYDRVKVLQTLEITPASHILDECILRSALGSRPPEIHYNWRPLWQPTTKERAETGKLIADTFKIVSDLEVLDPEVVAEALVNGLTENGLAAGLESGVVEGGDIDD
jgi:phage-related protein (TIGR01555 family)